MVDVEQWAQIRRMHVVDGVSIKEIVRRTGLARNTVRAAVRSDQPPSYERRPRPSKLDPFKEEIERLLRQDHRIPGTRIRELIEELGYEGAKTILDEHLREVRPRFVPRRTYQRTVYRPGEVCQFDLWEPRAEIPVDHGQTRRGWVVTCALGYSRAGAGALIFAKQAPDILWGMGRCLAKLGALPETVVWDREAAIAPRGKPTEAFAAFCGGAAGRLVDLRGRRPGVQGDPRAFPPLPALQLRTGALLRLARALPGQPRRLVREPRQHPPSPRHPRGSRRAAPRGARVDAGAARTDA